MTTRSAAWLIPFALLAVGACSTSSDNPGTPGDPTLDASLPSSPANDAAADAPPDAKPSPPIIPDILIANVASLELGSSRPGTAVAADVQVTNSGSTDIALTPSTFAASPPFAVSSTCPTSLAAGASCLVHVAVTPTAVGAITGTLTIPSSANTISVALHATGAFLVEIQRFSLGGGAVTSDPPGIDCHFTDGACEGLFSTPVTLTAIPPVDGVFLGWNPICGEGGPTCVVPIPGPDNTNNTVLFIAMFRSAPPPSHRVTVDFAGTSAGEVIIVDDTNPSKTPCVTSPCVADIPDGDHVTLWGFSPSQFAGWTGDCVATTHDCDLGALTSDRSAVVTFNRESQEVVSQLSSQRVPHSVAFAPDGGLYVTFLDIRKLRLDGTVEWIAPVSGFFDLTSDAAGNVYAVDAGGTRVLSLSPTGAQRWIKTLSVAPNFSRSIQGRVQVSSDGTIVALQTSDGARVLDGDGNDRFAITGITSHDGFAVAADGTIAIGVPAAAVNRRDVRRWTRDGTPLPTIPSLSGNFDVSLAFDASDAVCGVTVGAGVQTVSRTRADRTLAFRASALTGFSNQDPLSAIGVDSDGTIAIARSTEANGTGSGLHIDAFSPTGTKTFTLDKRAPQLTGTPISFDGVQIESFAVARSSRRIAVVGRYTQLFGWIQVFELPAAP